jgi:hypothetical protein
MQKSLPQGLKPDASKALMSEPKLRPPKRNDFFRSLFSLRAVLVAFARVDRFWCVP